MHILVIDQCSSSKSYPENTRELTADEVDRYRKGELRTEAMDEIPARELYVGRQPPHVDAAVEKLRVKGHNVDRYLISAGFGLVGEDERLPPYDVTFSTMGMAELDQRAAALEIPGGIRSLVSDGHYDVIFFAFGKTYARAAALEEALDALPEGTTAVLFSQDDLASSREEVHSIPAGSDQASEQGAGVIGLKGVYLENFAANVDEAVSPPPMKTIESLCRNSG